MEDTSVATIRFRPPWRFVWWNLNHLTTRAPPGRCGAWATMVDAIQYLYDQKKESHDH